MAVTTRSSEPPVWYRVGVCVFGEPGMAVPTGSSEPPVWYRVCVCVCGKPGLAPWKSAQRNLGLAVVEHLPGGRCVGASYGKWSHGRRDVVGEGIWESALLGQMRESRKPALALGDWGPTASNNCQPKNTNGTLLGPRNPKRLRRNGAIAAGVG